jgi:hypothetical protein
MINFIFILSSQQKLTVKDINKLYRYLNKVYFLKKLSIYPIKIGLSKDNSFVARVLQDANTFNILELQFHKRFSYLDLSKFIDVILHEMIHIDCIEKGLSTYENYHGEYFKQIENKIKLLRPNYEQYSLSWVIN